MHTLDEASCAKGKPLRSLWTADEARMVKHILNNLTVKQWNLPSTEVERDLSGDWTIWIPEGGGGAGTSAYRSYFRVIDASTTDPDVCKIGVTNGSSEMLDPVGNCGAVKINGERVDVEAVTETITADGVYHVWIHSWIDAADGPNAEIIVGPVDDNTPPDNPNGGNAFANQLAGRVTVADDVITSITQDYLTGGEHTELLFGDCEGEEIQVTP